MTADDAMRHLRALTGRWSFFAEPFEIYLAVAALASGLPVLLGVTAPTSLAHQLTPWVLRAWGAGLVAGAVLTLIARWLLAGARTESGQESAARLEVLGMTIFTGAGAMYATSILAVGIIGIPAGAFIAAFAGACATRARIITNEWRGHRAARRPRARRRRTPHG